MAKTTEQKQVLSAMQGARITRVNIVDGGKAVEIYSISEGSEEPVSKTKSKTSEYNFDEMFPVVEASKLTLEDKFLQYVPETYVQKKFKELIIEAIKSGLSDFRHPIMDPSEDENGKLFFKAENNPAVRNASSFWDRKAKEFMPEKNSRLGTKKQYVAFLGILIKELVEEEGYKESEAWEAVCEDNCKLGHRWRNFGEKYNEIGLTGSRRVGKWFDLASTCKIIREDNEAHRYLLAGGGYEYNDMFALALANLPAIINPDRKYGSSVGWIVLDV